jgi:EmrB/QacA subfamily drug resistance transporter
MSTNATTGPSNRGWTLVLASMGVFMAALDTLVVATALPVLHKQLGATLSDLEWTVNAYNLAFACTILTGAAMGDRFGRRRMYLVGLAIFTLASAAAALSSTPGALIGARALQGIGAAIVFPLTLTLISEAFPPQKRGAAIGIWGGISGAAVALGPLVGGAIIEGISWQWIFWINVPIGLILIPLSAIKLTESHGPRPQLDIPGLVLIGIGLSALTWGPIRAPEIGWGSGEVIATIVLGLVFVGLFLLRQARAQYPMLPLSFFRSRGFSTANAVNFFLFATLLGSLFVVVQLLQTAQGHSPLTAGLRILPWTAMPLLVAPLAGRLSDKVGTRPFMVLGMLLQATGLAIIASIASVDMSYGATVVGFVIAGVGMAICFPTVASTVVSSVPPKEAGVAAGTNNAMRQLGGVVGVAVVAAVFAANGSYASPQTFVDGFTPALWVAASLSVVGLVAALLAPGKTARPQPSAAPTAEPVGANRTR